MPTINDNEASSRIRPSKIPTCLKSASKSSASGSTKNALIKKFKLNYGYLILYVTTMALNGICVAWTTGGNN